MNFSGQCLRGFTLYELIITMLIISALVVFAVPRFSGSAGYDEYAYQARLISTLRHMQLRALNDTRPTYCFQVNFDNANDAFGPPTLKYTAAAGASSRTCSDVIDVDGLLLGAESAKYQHLFGLASELQQDNIDLLALNSVGGVITYIGFDHLGRPLTSDAGNDNCNAGCTIQFSSVVSTAQVCVEPQGYIHSGVCGG
ncbi:pilus assembly FimT family protein [Alteromonas sp. a30]|uniref:pilus assembly FimT family protein n=1 Tax=Alteromonas sp. a30 TaxID=2730917 RepID=UPI00227FA906|nr:prepilin-type N-terminal cleavage/methylation domain-containing protein [Alteromonas sp. a30]MCY7295267.1 prepilin-type N-terminal cleavage/methylation domain-containing protein [Alteromonas sp. a30]